MATVRLFSEPNADTHHAAKKLAEIFEEGLEDREDAEVHVLSDLLVHGQKRKDIDLLVCGTMGRNAYQLEWRSPETGTRATAYVLNFCLVIELKEHGPGRIWFKGRNLFVPYKNKAGGCDASRQSFEQSISLMNYLKTFRNLRDIRKLHPVNLLWLPSVQPDEVPSGVHNVLAGKLTLERLLRAALDNDPPDEQESQYGNSYFTFCCMPRRQQGTVLAISKELCRPFEPSNLDRKKIERVTDQLLHDQEYGKTRGSRLLMFRGRGGTGKTIRLLRFAHDVYQEGERCLLLTYNKALVADVLRLLALMKVSNKIDRPSIMARTIQSFMWEIMTELGVLDRSADDFLRRYDTYLDELLDFLSEDVVNDEDIRRLLESGCEGFSWDYLLIDEGQDWPERERQILFRLYGPQKLVVADGIDQFVRSGARCDWTKGVATAQRQIVSVRKTIRLKRNLALFSNSFAERFEHEDWRAEANDDAPGGRVILVKGEYDRALHEELLQRNAADGNEIVDMLFCVAPSDVSYAERTPRSELVGKIESWGYDTWNGTSREVRGTYPTAVSQHRVVQYDSCRGLEGWIVVNQSFDELFEYKFGSFEFMGEMQGELFESETDQRRRAALRWCLIPLTRAIDTQVLHLSDPASEFSRHVLSLADKHPDFVEVLD